jgi:hypothetical protein
MRAKPATALFQVQRWVLVRFALAYSDSRSDEDIASRASAWLTCHPTESDGAHLVENNALYFATTVYLIQS